MASGAITLGMQTSGEDNRTEPHVLALRRLLDTYCRGPYSDEIDEFALVLRVGGDMLEFDFEGCERIRRSRKQRYITVDLGLPSQRWKRATDREIRKYIVDVVETGLLCCSRRLEKDRSQIDVRKLMSDFNAAKMDYLAG